MEHIFRNLFYKIENWFAGIYLLYIYKYSKGKMTKIQFTVI